MLVPNLALHVGNGYRFINSDDILFCKSDGSRTHITLKNEETAIVNKKLKVVMETLNSELFVRIHNSHMINISCAIHYYSDKRELVLMSNGKQLKVSRSRKKEFLGRFIKL